MVIVARKTTGAVTFKQVIQYCGWYVNLVKQWLGYFSLFANGG